MSQATTTKKASRSKQEHVDQNGAQDAWEAYKDAAAVHARKAQKWKDAQEVRVVRGEDLVKVHAHVPFDSDAAARVAMEAAKAIKAEKDALAAKQKAKHDVDAAWKTIQAFEGDDPVQPLIPDDLDE